VISTGVRLGLAHLLGDYVIDRYRLARQLVWAKNQLAPERYRYPWRDGRATGYYADRPPWMAVWLMIAADNTVHLIVNALAVEA
jgi:hypothetical protein